MEYQNIIVTEEEKIALITINRPKALNALNQGVLNELEHFFQKEADPKKIDGVIITGSGDRAFVAGADIKEFLELDLEKATSMCQKVHNIYFSIEQFPKTVIAAVNGFALGGGCELAMACHLRIAGANAKFGQPEVNLGILPGYGGTQRLVQLIGKGKALELMMTTDMVNADEAVSLGLANQAVEAWEEVNAAKAMIQKIAKKAPLAIGGVISSVNAYFDKTKDGYAAEIEAFVILSESTDFKEGASAFIEKRKAEWKGE